MAALLLTCDLVNPYHERKDKEEEKKEKKGIMRKRSRGTGTSSPQRHSGKKGKKAEEKKIVQFSGTGESKDNNNTGNLSLSPLDSFLCAKIKKTTIRKRMLLWSLSLFLFGFFLVFFPYCSLTSWSISPVIHRCSFSNTVLLPFPRHTLSWRPLEQFKYNIKHMAEFTEGKWDEKSNLPRELVWDHGLWAGELWTEGVGEWARGEGTGEIWKSALRGWLFFLFFFFFIFCSLSLVGMHHVTMCNWPVVTPELCKQISGETCQPEGLRRWMCMLCESQMWDCVGNGMME